MFRWYSASKHCYVYLSDVSKRKRKADHETFASSWESAFRTSRWFKRGWTLQELLAPRTVKFFSEEGTLLGNKLSLEQHIHEVTHIPIEALRGTLLDRFTVDDRMSWIANRRTTREEDMAYSLLGLFGVSMAPLYGEGREAAMKRLQREIRDVRGTQGHPLDEDQRQMLMQSLQFDQIDARHLTIKNAHARTCRWLLGAAAYRDWIDPFKAKEHHGFLWIKGKPGTGKSTLMKFALANARKTMKDKVVIAYFFNARGELLERSTVGTYRSLLLQLLERLPGLQSAFEACALSAHSINVQHQWSDESLETLLEEVIQSLGQSHVICFIDALDECEERQVRRMISFFERIGQLTMSSGIRFQVCLSSRHYPEITIEKGLILELEGQEGHTQDIINYVESELKIGKTKVAQQIRNDLQERASSVFMWVVLVVDMLKQEFDRGRTSLTQMRQRLREISKDLHQLFRDILTRDTRNPGELILCIQWVLFAKQPLSPEQLHFAILSGTNPEDLARWDIDETTTDDMRRRLLDASKGLTEITKSKKPTVQFIHESVRDFLLKDNGLAEVFPELKHDFEGQSHEKLKRCCTSYMNLDIGDWECADPAQSDSLLQAFPFLRYAVQNVLYHADAAQGGGVNQQIFMQEFLRERWIKLDNMFEKHKIRRHTSTMSILYALCERNLSHLIRSHTNGALCFNVEPEHCGTPFLAAIANSSVQAVCAMVDALHVQNMTGTRAGKIYMHYYQDRHGKSLVLRDFTFPKKKSLMQYLMDIGSGELIVLALLAGQSHTGVLGWAAERGRQWIVKFLLERSDINVDEADNMKQTPLLHAAQQGHEAIVVLLLDTGKVDVNTNGHFAHTPLYYAICNGHNEMAVQLLGTGKVDIDGLDRSTGNQLLAWAAQFKQNETFELLRRSKHADINQKDVHGRTALVYAAVYGYTYAVKMLLQVDNIDVNATDAQRGTPLFYAVKKGSVEIVEMLLKIGGVDVNAIFWFPIAIEKDWLDMGGSTPLIYATRKGQKEVVELLLTIEGVEVNAKDTLGNTPLMHAVLQSDADLVQQLVEHKEVDVNSTDQDGKSPLIHAVETYQGHVVQLLLSQDMVNINAIDISGNTALVYAVKRGFIALVKLLLGSTSVRSEAKPLNGTKALVLAAQMLFMEAVQLLLDSDNVEVFTGHDLELTLQWMANEQKYSYLADRIVHSGRVDLSANKHSRVVTLIRVVQLKIGASFGLLLETDKTLVNIRSPDGNSLLMDAAKGGELDVVKLLLEYDSLDINASTSIGLTALSLAAMCGHTAIVELLLATGRAKVDVKAITGTTPLMSAAENGHHDIVHLLLSRGKAGMHFKSKRGSTALMLAKQKKHQDIVCLLQSYSQPGSLMDVSE